MDASALQHFEALCERFYTTTDAAARQAADEQLRNLRSDSRFCPQLLHVFQHSRSHYALFVSCNSLTELVSSHWGDFTHAQTLEIRTLPSTSSPLSAAPRLPPPTHTHARTHALTHRSSLFRHHHHHPLSPRSKATECYSTSRGRC